MTDREFISKLKDFKEIKPRKEWVVLTKSQILGPEVVSQPVVFSPGVFANVLAVLGQKKFAYAFSVLLLAAIGAVGMGQYALLNTTSNPAAVLGETSIKTSLADYKSKSLNLATAPKADTASRKVAVKELQTAAKNLAAAIAKNPVLAKDVALELKQEAALAALTDGPDAKETTDMLYQVIDEQMIADLDRATLTEDQQTLLVEIKALYAKKDFSGALEKILVIGDTSMKK